MGRVPRICIGLLAMATILSADSRRQTFEDFVTPLPLKPGETLVLGIVGGWERWDNPGRCIRRTAVYLKRRQLPGVHVETVENHSLDLAERLIREAFDFDGNGTLTREEARRARLILFGQSLGGRATLRLARTIEAWGITVQLAVVVDAYGRDSYVVPANVRAAANYFQRDQFMVKGASEIRTADPRKTRILLNRQVTYEGKAPPTEFVEESFLRRTFMGSHLILEFDLALWREVEDLIADAASEGEPAIPTQPAQEN